MKIITVEANIAAVCFAKITQNCIDEKVLKALSIQNFNNSNPRGVIVHEVENKLISQLKLYTKAKVKVTFFKKIIFLLNEIFNQFFKKKKSNIIIQDSNSKEEVTDIKYKTINHVKLYPENDNFAGFIINFEHPCKHSTSLIIQFYSESLEIVISSQSQYKCNHHSKIDYSGLLAIIHCDESSITPLNYYCCQLNIDTQQSEVSKNTLILKPLDSNTINIQYHISFAKTLTNELHTIDNSFFYYLMKTCDEDIKAIYEILDDKESKQLFFEEFKQDFKFNSYNINFNYTRSSVL